MAEANRTPEESKTARAGESGMVVRIQLRGLQPGPYPETTGAECMKPPQCLVKVVTNQQSNHQQRILSELAAYASTQNVARKGNFNKLLEPIEAA